MSLKERLFLFLEENESLINPLFFIGGVLFDFLTLNEIDDFYSFLQQFLYLTLIGSLLWVELAQFERFLKSKWWIYKDFVLHFMLGSLLSLYSIFYIKSSSFSASFFFILFMILLLVGNELQLIQKQKISLKLALYLVCVFSFFSILVPILLGSIGLLSFYLSVLSTVIFIWLFYKSFNFFHKNRIKESLVFYPTCLVLSVFVVFYIFGWIPPVPLSIQEIGVYHSVEKLETNYELKRERPDWKFWLKGDQNFRALPGDRIYIFSRIFSPTRIKDQLILNWQYQSAKQGWQTTDRIKLLISGGRKQGFRAYAFKEKYQEGSWRVLVETRDGREVGRLYFAIYKEPEALGERKFYNELR